MAVAVVTKVSAGSWNAEEAACSDAGSDVVGYMVDVQLAQIIAVGGHNPAWSAHIHCALTILTLSTDSPLELINGY